MLNRARGVPSMPVDFVDYEFNQDPYPVLEMIRAAGPVVYNEAVDAFVITSFQNCSQVLGNVGRFDGGPSAAAITEVFGGITMEALDTPRHHEMRGVWARDFERATLESKTPIVEQAVERMVVPFVERVRSGETVDAIPAMTRHIPTLVIAAMLGIDESMYEQFASWSDAMGSMAEGAIDASPRGHQLVTDGIAATRALNAFIAAHLDERSRNPGDDLISRMVVSEFGRMCMEESEIVASNTQLVFAGNETTAKMMAATLVALAQHPDQRRVIAADRSLVPQAFEEVHRWQTLTQALRRRACRADSEIDGVQIPEGATVTALLGAANRDPQRWERPSDFDIMRPRRQHLGFGFGMHLCLGLNLARLEVRIWLERLLELLPEYSLATDRVDYGTNFILRGPRSVPVALT